MGQERKVQRGGEIRYLLWARVQLGATQETHTLRGTKGPRGQAGVMHGSRGKFNPGLHASIDTFLGRLLANRVTFATRAQFIDVSCATYHMRRESAI